jgi:hypothetical protein
MLLGTLERTEQPCCRPPPAGATKKLLLPSMHAAVVAVA